MSALPDLIGRFVRSYPANLNAAGAVFDAYPHDPALERQATARWETARDDGQALARGLSQAGLGDVAVEVLAAVRCGPLAESWRRWDALRPRLEVIALCPPPVAPPAPVAPPVPPAPAPVKPKVSTRNGDGETKLIAALVAHHRYADGGCLNHAPAENNKLARTAGVRPATASRFLAKHFGGHAAYAALCRQDRRAVRAVIMTMLGETPNPRELTYGRRPPNERDGDDDDD